MSTSRQRNPAPNTTSATTPRTNNLLRVNMAGQYRWYAAAPQHAYCSNCLADEQEGHVISMLDMLEGRAGRAWDMLDMLEGRASRAWRGLVVYIDPQHDPLGRSCSTHLNYLVTAFIVEAYVISYWPSYDCLWQTSPLKQTQVIPCTLEEGDLTTLNTLRMSTSGQRNLAPSTTSATMPRINNHFDDRVKINKLDVYKGERDELNDWLIQMKLYFAFNSISKNQKTLFAFTYLRGRVQHWFKSKVRSYLDDEKNINDRIFTRFNDFKIAIRRIFGVFNEEQFVEKIIQHLKQHEFAFNYVTRFQKYVNIIDWDDSTLQTMYRRELKEQVKDELMRDGRAYETLDELIEIFIDFDDKLYERVMKKKYDEELKGRVGTYSSRLLSSYFGGSSFDRRRHADGHAGIVSMELDFTIRPNKGKNPKAKRGHMKKDKTCYSCGKSSHFVLSRLPPRYRGWLGFCSSGEVCQGQSYEDQYDITYASTMKAITR